MKSKIKWGIAGTLAFFVVVAAVIATVFLVRPAGAEAAPSPAAQTTEALAQIRATGATIVCGNSHSPRILAGVPVRFEENFLFFKDGYQLYVKEPFSFYSGKYHGFQIEDGVVTQSLLVGSEDYYPCPINNSGG